MARIRTIKPDFFTSEDVSVLPLRARLTWIGLWTHCDDHGRTKDVVRLIKAAVWPLDDVGLADVEEDLITLAAGGRIVRYDVDGKGFLAVVNWHVHQAISKPSRPRHPAAPVAVGPMDPGSPGYCMECHPTLTGNLPEGSGRTTGGFPLGKEGKGKEGTREAPDRPPVTTTTAASPPLRCPRHLHATESPPCGACADTRRAHEAWQRQQKSQPTPTPGTPECPEHPGQPTGSKQCPECKAATAPPRPGDLRAAVRGGAR